MIRLALIGSIVEAQALSAVADRLQNAAFVAYASSRDEPGRLDQDVPGVFMQADTPGLLLENHAEAFDAILIYAGADQCGSLIKRAALAGKHILAQSPFAVSLQALDEIVRLCQESQVVLVAGNPLRFTPVAQTVKSSLKDGTLGAPGLLRIHRWMPAPAFDGKPMDAHLERILPEIDLANWIFEGMPNRIFSLSRLPESTSELPGFVQVHLGFSGGGMALIDYAWTLPDGADYFSLSLIGSGGAAYADDHHNMNLLFAGGEASALRVGDGHAHLLPQIQSFIQTLGRDTSAATSNGPGREAMQVAETVISAARSGQVAGLTREGYEFF